MDKYIIFNKYAEKSGHPQETEVRNTTNVYIIIDKIPRIKHFYIIYKILYI